MLVAVLFRYTVLGFMLDVLGRNRQAAIHAGMPVNRLDAGGAAGQRRARWTGRRQTTSWA